LPPIGEACRKAAGRCYLNGPGSQAQPSKQLPVDFFTIAPLVM